MEEPATRMVGARLNPLIPEDCIASYSILIVVKWRPTDLWMGIRISSFQAPLTRSLQKRCQKDFTLYLFASLVHVVLHPGMQLECFF